MRVELSLMKHPFQDKPVFPGFDGIAAATRKIEELGFDGVLVPEAGHDPFMPLLIAAEHSESLTLRTGVALAFPRSPGAVAYAAWDLQRYSKGRFLLGLGTQVKAHNERRYGVPWDSPAGPRLRDYLGHLKAMFATFQSEDGRAVPYAGEHYNFNLMLPFFNPGPTPYGAAPIYIAAVNPYMCRLAGEICDGAYPHPVCTPTYIRERMLPAIGKGAAKAGRDLAEVKMLISPMIVTGADAAEVEAKKPFVKQRLGFYASTKAYHSALEVHGHRELGEQLYALSREGKWGDMVELIDDGILETYATVAPYAELGDALAERWGGVLDTLHLDLVAELDSHPKELRASWTPCTAPRSHEASAQSHASRLAGGRAKWPRARSCADCFRIRPVRRRPGAGRADRRNTGPRTFFPAQPDRSPT